MTGATTTDGATAAAAARTPTPERLAADLEAARRRSLDLLEPVTELDLCRQHSPLMSPLVWDLAHVANYEELWLVRALTGEPGLRPELDSLYDAFRNPRATRAELPLLGPAQARHYAAVIRSRVLDVLDDVSSRFDSDDLPLLARGFVHAMVVQHEHQHDETMLATLQLMASPGYRPAAPAPPIAPDPGASPLAGGAPTEVLVDGGTFRMGTDADPWALDNERPAHDVELDPFWIDTFPVTNGRYAEFMADGGYDEPRWWSGPGWSWCQEAGLRHPQFWHGSDGGRWWRNRFGWIEPVPDDEPVQHVCWYEADAFARWAGKRLPTEAEWEMAASWEPNGSKRSWPWGDGPAGASRANLGQRHFGPAPVGAYPGGTGPWGTQQQVGDVWEWTSSDFTAHPGFASFPYKEYSEVFYGSQYKVLRGGSWATHPAAMRATFRNWDLPIRRQIFAGFRCARSA